MPSNPRWVSTSHRPDEDIRIALYSGIHVVQSDSLCWLQRPRVWDTGIGERLHGAFACAHMPASDCQPQEAAGQQCVGVQAPRIDPESLEQENDRSIDALSERTNLLRQVWLVANHPGG